MFDGGDLDCGSGLILLIRDAMRQVPVDGILEMRSREPNGQRRSAAVVPDVRP